MKHLAGIFSKAAKDLDRDLLGDSGKVAIYAFVDPFDHEIKYVGRSIHPHVRFFEHMTIVRSRPDKDPWLYKLLTIGSHPKLLILEIVDAEHAGDAEHSWSERHLKTLVRLSRNGTPRAFLTVTFQPSAEEIRILKKLEKQLTRISNAKQRREQAVRLAINLAARTT